MSSLHENNLRGRFSESPPFRYGRAILLRTITPTRGCSPDVSGAADEATHAARVSQLRKSSLTPSQSLRNIPSSSTATSCGVRLPLGTSAQRTQSVVCRRNRYDFNGLTRIRRVRIP